MRHTRPLLITSSAALLIAGLTACSTDGGGSGLTYEDSPLAEYTNAMYGGGMTNEEWQAQYDDQNAQAEELIAECMAEEGFEYTPNLSNGGVMVSSDDDEWNPDSREWVSQYGYGAFNDPWSDQEEPSGEAEEYVDPNGDYVASLTESEQEAYYEVLNGEQPSEEAWEDPEFDWEAFYETADPGCYGHAWEDVQDTNAQEELYTQYEDLFTRMNEVYDDLQSSPEIVELDAEWASCMADAGFTGYTHQSDAANEFYEAVNVFYEEQNAASEELDWEATTEEEINAFYEESDPSSSPEWAENAEREIEVALADLDCREKTDYNDTSLKAQFALEEKFIADNKAELEEFKAAAEQVG